METYPLSPTASGAAAGGVEVPSAPRSEWIEQRRGDGELVGWTVLADEGFHVVDLLGRQRTLVPVDWTEAEEMLERLGIGYLADRYTLLCPDGVVRRVRISEVSTERVIVLDDELGDALVIGAKPEMFVLPFPAPQTLQTIG